MGRDRGRILLHLQLCLALLAPGQHSSRFALVRIYPRLWFVVRTRSRSFNHFLIDKSIFKSFDARSETWVRFYQLYSKLVQAEILKRLCALHLPVYLLEAVCDTVTARTGRIIRNGVSWTLVICKILGSSPVDLSSSDSHSVLAGKLLTVPYWVSISALCSSCLRLERLLW